MKVVYVLNGTALYGGVKVVFQHAESLRRLGVDAEVVSPEPPPDWFPAAAAFYRQLPDLTPEAIGPADIAVGTIYYTVPIAERVPGAVAAHLCQCWEAGYEPIREEWPRIEEIYRRATVKLAVSPHLAELIERKYGQPCTWIPQPLQTDIFSPGAMREHNTFRVLVSGRWDLDVKGVERAMRALRTLVEEEPHLELVRLTQAVFDEERAFWPEAEYHAAIAPSTVPELMRNIDAYVGLSTDVEGFGLPTLEAMSCARPAVVSDISAHRALDPHTAATIRVPADDAEALRAAVRRLRDDPAFRARLGREGRRIAENYSEERTGRMLKEVFDRVLAGTADFKQPAKAGEPSG